MDYQSITNRLLKAETLLNDTSTNKEKFDALRDLIHGINPNLDKTLAQSSDAFSKIEGIMTGDIITVSSEYLPEQTEEEKKRKRAILFFIKTWNDLKGEVRRVRQAYEQQAAESRTSAGTLTKLIAYAKGPLGLITIAAIALVFLQMQAGKVAITNRGCNSFSPPGILTLPLPGLQLPKGPIVDGATETAVVPPLTLTVDATNKGAIKVKTLGVAYTFKIDNIGLEFDGVTLNGKETDITISRGKTHQLVITCN